MLLLLILKRFSNLLFNDIRLFSNFKVSWFFPLIFSNFLFILIQLLLNGKKEEIKDSKCTWNRKSDGFTLHFIHVWVSLLSACNLFYFFFFLFCIHTVVNTHCAFEIIINHYPQYGMEKSEKEKKWWKLSSVCVFFVVFFFCLVLDMK